MENKRIFYIANMRFPTERAHGIQVAYMCSALAMTQIRADKREDADARRFPEVTLIVPDRKTFDADPFEYYGVTRNFTVEKIPVPDTVRFGKAGFFIESLIFAFRAARRVRVKSNIPPQSSHQSGGGGGESIVYTRDEWPFLFLPRSVPAFYEAHQLRRIPFFRRIIRRARGIIAITQGLKDAFVRIGFSESKILAAHDGYDEKRSAVSVTKKEARKLLCLPEDARIAMYIGGLEKWKGAETLCKAATLLAQDNIRVVFIGGTAEEIKLFRTDYPDALFLGARPYRELPQNQQAADVLVIPNSAQERISREFTSPLKLFAHMASGIPIVASRLPSLTEILSEENAYLVEPDNSPSLASGILAALRNPSESAERAKKAAVDVAPYSWDRRAQRILAWLLNERNGKGIV